MSKPATVFKAPDGGWGWMVVIASFFLQAVSIGITYTYGILYVELMNDFHSSESETAWIGSIQPALLYLVGVISGPLLRRYGWRFVVILGSIIAASGFTLSYFAANLYTLYFTYGALTGIGFGLMYMTSMVTVQHYFEKYRSMATGIAVSGSGMGTLCFGFFTQFLLDTFHWRLTLLIEGAITMLVGTICAALFRPLPDAHNHEHDHNNHEHDPLIATEAAHNGSKRVTYDVFSPDSLNEAMHGSRQSPTSAEHGTPNTSSGSVGFSSQSSPSSESSSPRCMTHSLIKQLDFRSSPTLPDIAEDTDAPNGCCTCCGCNALTACDKKFHLSLCKNPKLFICCLMISLFSFGYHVPYAFTPVKAIEAYHITPRKASFLVSVMGISNVAFRLIFGWIGDKSARVRFYVLGLVIVLCGANSVLAFLDNTFILLILYSALFGSFSGCFASLYPVVIVDLMGLDVIEYTLGMAMASSSLGFLVGAPLSGWVVQKLNGYNTAFCVIGSIQIIAGCIFFTIKLLPERYLLPLPDVTDRGHGRRKNSFFTESIA